MEGLLLTWMRAEHHPAVFVVLVEVKRSGLSFCREVGNSVPDAQVVCHDNKRVADPT